MEGHTAVRLQTYFSRPLYQRLQEQTHREGKSLAQVVREAVEEYLVTREQERAVPDDPLWKIPTLVAQHPANGPKDGAARHDDYLYGPTGRP